MSLICPRCDAHSLEIIRALELSSDASSDEITVYQIACARHGLHGAAVYLESRRGRLDAESWDHSGFILEDGDYWRLDGLTQACPNSASQCCNGGAHTYFNQLDPAGHWRGLAGFQVSTPFPMVLG